MAFFYLRTSILKASKGKSAVASSAYMTAQTLYNERLGRTFSYKNKEEVVHSEVMIPPNAPDKYKNRQILWNAVEKRENKENSRYARQFIIATPKEWNREETVERVRNFIQNTFVDKGMCVDWAFHEKDGNPHLHIMATVRGIKSDGSWAQMEKKEYVLDKDGNKIPEIDPTTGEQKVRHRIRNGKESTERLWKRITVQSNEWNSRVFLTEIKREWADTCNKYLKAGEQIDYRSLKERGINRIPLIHEGAEARASLRKGIVFDQIRENEERRKINQELARLEAFVKEAKKLLQILKERINQWRNYYGKTGSVGTDRIVTGNGKLDLRVSEIVERIDRRTRSEQGGTEELEKNIRRRH